jgi:hypothetical protein
MLNKMKNKDQNKELLMKAIDNYALLPKTGRVLLKTLINLAIDDIIVINIKELSKLSNISRPSVYSSLKVLEDNGFIQRQNNPRSRLSSFIIKPHKFENIIQHYTVRQNILHN